MISVEAKDRGGVRVGKGGEITGCSLGGVGVSVARLHARAGEPGKLKVAYARCAMVSIFAYRRCTLADFPDYNGVSHGTSNQVEIP